MSKGGGVSRQIAEIVIERDGQCVVRVVHERQSKPGEQIHHRKPRRMGGSTDPDVNSACNLIYVCRACHEYLESHRSQAMDNGWLLGARDKPDTTPLLYLGRFLYLTHDGETPQFLSTPWVTPA